MKFYLYIYGVFAILLSNTALAQSTVKGLTAADSYIPETAKLVNQADAQGHALLKKAIKTEAFKIPKNWRLVSVLPETKSNAAGQDYIMFFQDNQGAVHSVGVQMSGAVSGKNLLYIPAE
jgi:hypothetical protein